MIYNIHCDNTLVLFVPLDLNLQCVGRYPKPHFNIRQEIRTAIKAFAIELENDNEIESEYDVEDDFDSESDNYEYEYKMEYN